MNTDQATTPTVPANAVYFSGRFEADPSELALHALESYPTWSDFLAANQERAGRGSQLCGIHIGEDYLRVTQYTGVWMASPDTATVFQTSDWGAFVSQFDAMAKTKVGLADINFAVIDGKLLYTGVWLGNPGGQVLLHDLTFEELLDQLGSQNQAGLQLIKAQCRVGSEGDLLYTALFQPGLTEKNGVLALNGWQAFCSYVQTDPDRDNLNCLQVLNYGLQGAQNVLGVWASVTQSHQFVFGLKWEAFVAQWRARSAQGLRLKSVSAGLNPLSWPAAFREVFRTRAVGYTCGVANNGVVATASARGWAIRPVSGSAGTPMSPGTPITLGSVSKTIEAVAMLYLIQLGTDGVTLDTPFFGLINNKYGISSSDITDPLVEQITIRHLLTHSAGLDDPVPNVPDNTNATLWAVVQAYISQALNPLKLGPQGEIGMVYCYSNTGFQTIRGIVQAITGADTYQDWVTTNILQVLGMTSTYVPVPGQSYALRYYQRNLELAPNNGVIPNEASWNSTPGDMLTLLASLRGIGTTILDPASLMTMFTATTLPYSYDDGPPPQQVAAPVSICLGFDAASAPAPAYVAKNGAYAGYSRAAIVQFDAPPLDVVVQLNTDTFYNPVTGQPDGLSLDPEALVINTFPKLEGNPAGVAPTSGNRRG